MIKALLLSSMQVSCRAYCVTGRSPLVAFGVVELSGHVKSLASHSIAAGGGENVGIFSPVSVSNERGKGRVGLPRSTFARL